MIQLKSDGLISRKISGVDDLPRFFFSWNTGNCFLPLCFLPFRQLTYCENLPLRGCEFTIYDNLMWQLRVQSWIIEVPTSITLGLLTGSYDYPVIRKHTLRFCSILKNHFHSRRRDLLWTMDRRWRSVVRMMLQMSFKNETAYL